MRLAEHVAGTTDVDAMLDAMTVQQFDEWAAKDMVEPVGYQSQMLGLIGYLVHGAVGDGTSDATVEDFMPWLRYQERQVNNAGAKELLKGLFGGNSR